VVHVLQAILIFNIVDFTPLSFGDYVLPDWSQTLGWLMAVAPVAMIPIFAVYQFVTLSAQPPYSQLGFWRVNNKKKSELITEPDFDICGLHSKSYVSTYAGGGSS